MYSNNTEYRAALRQYFKMDVRSKETEHADVDDPESYDELLYDDDAMKRGMDTILDKTRENTRFIRLYTLAAGRFISEDPEIGLCVLLSYDFFADFIVLYENPENDEYYQLLINKLS